MLNYPTDGGQEKPCFSNFVTPNCEIHSKTPLKNPIVANQAVIEYLYTNHPPQGVDVKLCDISERDSVWDSHRNQTSLVSDIYSEIQEFERYAERLDGCSGYLKFGWNDNKFVLKQAFFFAVFAIALSVNGVGHCYGKPLCTKRMSKSKSSTPHTALYS